MEPTSIEKTFQAFCGDIRRKQFLPTRVDIKLEAGMFMITKIGQMFKPHFVIDEINRVQSVQ